MDEDDIQFWSEAKLKPKSEQVAFQKYILTKYPVLNDKQIYIDDKKNSIFGYASPQEVYRNIITE